MNYSKKSYSSGVTLIEILIVVAILFVLFGVLLPKPFVGVFPFGPKETVTAKVERLYVDYANNGETSSSHYMVGTDAGVFECDNSFWLGLWDADERYSRLKEGETYTFVVKGRKVTNFLFQEYPGIVEIRKVVTEVEL